MAAPSQKVLSEVQMQLDLVTSQCGSVMQQLDLLKDRVIRNSAADEVKKDETDIRQSQVAEKPLPVQLTPPTPQRVPPAPTKPKSRGADRNNLLSSSDDNSFSDASLDKGDDGKKKDIIQLMYERLRMMDGSGFHRATGQESPSRSHGEESDRDEFHDLSPSSDEEKVDGRKDLEHILSSMNFIQGPNDESTSGRKEKRGKKDDSLKKNAVKKRLRAKKVKMTSSPASLNKKEKKSKNKVSPYEVAVSKTGLNLSRPSETVVKQRSSLQCSSDNKVSVFQKKLTPKKKTEILLKKPDHSVFNEPFKRVKKISETLKKSTSQLKKEVVEDKAGKNSVAVKFEESDVSISKKDSKKEPQVSKTEEVVGSQAKKAVSAKQPAPKSKPVDPPKPPGSVAKKESAHPSKPVELATNRSVPTRRTSLKSDPRDNVQGAELGRVTRQTSFAAAKSSSRSPPVSLQKPSPPFQINKNSKTPEGYMPSRETFTVGNDSHIRRTKSFVARQDVITPNVALPAISFNAIPFIVGQSTSKSYHIGLNIQQTLSLLKITPSLTGIPILNDKTSKDASSTTTSLFSSKRTNSCLEENTCPACKSSDKDESFYNEENDDTENRDPWAVPLREPWEMPNRLPSKCTCLPKPVVSIHHVLSQLLQSDKAMASQHAINTFQNIQEDKYLDEDEKLKQSVRKYTGSNTLYFAKLLKTMQGFRERVIKSEM